MYILIKNLKIYVLFALLVTASSSCKKSAINPLEAKLLSGLVAYYPFNGNANDESGNGNHGTVYNAILTKDRFQKDKSAYYFNGVSGTRIQTNFPGILGNESRSISLWVRRFEKPFNANHIVMWGTPSIGKCYTVFMSGIGDSSLIGIDNGGSAIARKMHYLELADSKWHNYTFTYDNLQGANVSRVKIFIDGKYYQSNFFYNTNNINTVPQINLVIGQYLNGLDDRTFLGEIDDVRLYNRVLTEEEISYLATK